MQTDFHAGERFGKKFSWNKISSTYFCLDGFQNDSHIHIGVSMKSQCGQGSVWSDLAKFCHVLEVKKTLAIFKIYLLFGNSINLPTLTIFYAIRQICILVNGQILCK